MTWTATGRGGGDRKWVNPDLVKVGGDVASPRGRGGVVITRTKYINTDLSKRAGLEGGGVLLMWRRGAGDRLDFRVAAQDPPTRINPKGGKGERE
jgi:hypothetical protein